MRAVDRGGGIASLPGRVVQQLEDRFFGGEVGFEVLVGGGRAGSATEPEADVRPDRCPIPVWTATCRVAGYAATLVWLPEIGIVGVRLRRQDRAGGARRSVRVVRRRGSGSPELIGNKEHESYVQRSDQPWRQNTRPHKRFPAPRTTHCA